MTALARLLDPLLVVYALLAYGLLVWGVHRSYPVVAVGAALIASPLLLLALRRTLERDADLPLVDLVHGSWSFQLGDTFVLTTAFAICAVAYRSLPAEQQFTSWKWILGCFAVGLLLGMGFHWMEIGNYTSKGLELALNSPTKHAHDFVAYSVLSGGAIAVGWPVLKQWNGYSWAFLACLVVHVVLMAADTYRAINGTMIHSRLHPLVDALTLHVIK